MTILYLRNRIQQRQINSYILKNYILCKILNDQEVFVAPEIMQIMKRSLSLGHFSIAKTDDSVKQDFYFPNIKRYVESVLNNFIECTLVNKNRGEREGFLNPIYAVIKISLLIILYFCRQVKPIIAFSFTRVTRFYPVKTYASHDVIEKLKRQQAIFGNSAKNKTVRGAVFSSKKFKDYCNSRISSI